MEKLLNIRFSQLMNEQIYKMISHLLNEGIEFGIFVRIDELEFNPKLPKKMLVQFQDITHFVLANYTFESALLEKNKLQFEAGFGKENFGSIVTVPLLSIIQILVKNNPILINLAQKVEIAKVSKQKEARREKSRNIFLSNPENSMF